jgi:probable phosphoglycerate mutase
MVATVLAPTLANVELLLVRHARPHRVESDDGPVDPSLDEEGRRQAEALGEWLTAESIDSVYASPLARAVETAEPLVARLGLQLVQDDGVIEWDRDSTAYIPIEELKAGNHPAWVAMRDERWDLLGADPAAFRERVVTSIDAIAAAHPSQRVAVVCHGGVINAYTADVLGLDRIFWFEPRYTSITRVLVHRDGHRSLFTLNELPHLRS